MEHSFKEGQLLKIVTNGYGLSSSDIGKLVVCVSKENIPLGEQIDNIQFAQTYMYYDVYYKFLPFETYLKKPNINYGVASHESFIQSFAELETELETELKAIRKEIYG